jgi:predicted amidohydrolase YtcJ
MGHPPTGEWVLVDDRHIQRVGSGEVPPADRVVELPGTTIVPGMIDTHVHLTSTGQSLADTEAEDARSADELLAVASSRASGAEPGTIVLLSGFDESRWASPTLPTIAQLDAVTGPLVIRRIDGHLSLANTAALDRSGVTSQEGCELDPEGRPTGKVTAIANRSLSAWVADELSELQIEELQLAACALAASRGITSVHEMSMPLEHGWRDVEVLLAHRDKLPVDVTPVVATMDVPRAVELGLAAIGGDLAVDGSIGARTASLMAPYVDVDDDGLHGFADDELVGFFHDGHDAGLQVGVHAIGDRAIAQVLTAWERVYRSLDSRERRHFRARRHRIEHFEMASPELVERAASLGLAVSVQPAFDATWGGPGGLYESRLGVDRSVSMNPIRTMLERGLVVGAGSDAPVTPLDPWIAVAAMEDHHAAEQRLGRVEAVRVHTAGSARVGHQEEKKGLLEPGYHADLCAYEIDPLVTDDPRSLAPVLTVSLGREVFVA